MVKRTLLALMLVFCAASARASISLTQSNHGSSTGTNSATCTLSSSLASGDLVVIDASWGELTAVNSDYSVTDGASTSYSAVLTSPVSPTNANQATMWWGKLPSGQFSLTVTLTVSGHGNHTIRLGCFDYASGTGWNTIDHTNSGSSSSAVTSGNPGNVTPSASGYLVHSMIEFGVATNNNAVSTCTMQPAGGSSTTGWISDGRANSADDQNSGNTAETCSYTWSNAAAYGAIIASFAPSAAGTSAVRHKVVQQ